MEPKTGFEPVTSSLPRMRSTPELLGLNSQALFKKNFGAGDETRTRDIQLGRLTLYQLSYSRKSEGERMKEKVRVYCYFILYRLPSQLVHGVGFEPT